MARDQMKFAEMELELARKKYEDEKRTMLEFQSRSEHLNAQAAAESRANFIATLEAELTTQRATLNGLLSAPKANTHQARQDRKRVLEGKSVTVHGHLGGWRNIEKNTTQN